MDKKILIEEINRINELTGSKALFSFTENKITDNDIRLPLTEQTKKLLTKVDDIFRAGTALGKSRITMKNVGKVRLPKEWKVFKNLKSLNGTGKNAIKYGQKIEAYLGHGLKAGKNMSGNLQKIIGTTDDVGAAIAKNLHTDKMKVFLNGTSKEAGIIKKNIAYALETSPKLKANVLGPTQKFVTKVKPPKVKTTGPKTTTKTKTKKTPGRNPTGLTLKQIVNKTGVVVKKIVPSLKSLVSGFGKAITWATKLKISGKLILAVGIWFAYTSIRDWWEGAAGDEEPDTQTKMETAFTSGLAYNQEGADISVSEAEALTFADEAMADFSSLIQTVKDNCVTLQDVSMISLQYALKNNDSELYDTLYAFKDKTREEAPGLGGVFGELEPIVETMPIISLGGVLCYTKDQMISQAERLGIDPNKAPGVIEGLVQDWSSYPCVLTMYGEYDGTVGHSGDKEYVKITIDDRDAYFLPDGTCQLSNPDNPKLNYKGTYSCTGDEADIEVEAGEGGFNESRKLSDILKENKVITEEEDGDIVSFGDVTITIGAKPEEVDGSEYNDTDGNVSSTTTTTTPTSSGVKYVITTVSLADVVAGKGILKKGDMGDSVRAIQTAVDTKDDSKFGPNTEEAVRVYQKRNGLEVTGTINQETAKRITGSTDVDQGKVNTNVVTKPKDKVVVVTNTDANEMDKVVTQLDNTDDVYIKDQINDLDTQVSRAPTKQACKTLIASAKAGIKKGVYLKDLSSLKQCYNAYDFTAWFDGSRKVRKHYGLKGKGNI